MKKDIENIGKRIRVNKLIAEPDYVNSRYKGRTGTIGFIDDANNYHIIWDDSDTDKTSGLAVLPDVDDFEFINEGEKENNGKAINESFTDKALSSMVAEHGGLKKLTDKYEYDARLYNNSFDIQYAKPCVYIPKDVVSEYIIGGINPFKPLCEQILRCNDGGIIIIEQGEDEPKAKNGSWEKPYMEKIHSRGNNFRDDNGASQYPYIGMNKHTNVKRKRAHYNMYYDKAYWFDNPHV